VGFASFKRKKIFVMPKFQFLFLIYSLSLAAIPLIVLNLSRSFMYMFADTSTLVLVSVFTVVTLLLLGLVGIVLSNRIAGPLHRLTRHLKDVAEGRTTDEIRFRDKDYFSDLAESANIIIRRLKKP
jgi:signal transduction histidine kinase